MERQWKRSLNWEVPMAQRKHFAKQSSEQGFAVLRSLQQDFGSEFLVQKTRERVIIEKLYDLLPFSLLYQNEPLKISTS